MSENFWVEDNQDPKDISTMDLIRGFQKALSTATPAPGERPNISLYRYNNGRAHKSEALGVHPSQIGETRKHLRKHGLCVDFDESGRCLVDSEKQYQDVARAIGMKDGRDGYQVTDYRGDKIQTGREQGRQREETKKMLREALGYPDDYNGPTSFHL